MEGFYDNPTPPPPQSNRLNRKPLKRTHRKFDKEADLNYPQLLAPDRGAGGKDSVLLKGSLTMLQ